MKRRQPQKLEGANSWPYKNK